MEKITVEGHDYFLKTREKSEDSRNSRVCHVFNDSCMDMDRDAATACFMGCVYMDIRANAAFLIDRASGRCPVIQGEN